MGANPSISDHDGATALHYAVQDGRLEIIELLRRWDVKDEIMDAYGRTAIHWATIRGNEEPLWELLRCRANPNIECKAGMTALHYAACKGFAHLISMLLEYGANPAAKDKSGKTALHHAVREGHRSTAVKLLDMCKEDDDVALTHSSWNSEVDVNAEDNVGLTPLHYAASKHVEIVSDLINRGADPQARCARGVLPVHLAAKAGKKAIVVTLLERTPDSEDSLYRISSNSLDTPCKLLSFLALIYPDDHIYPSLLGDVLWTQTLYFDAVGQYERSIELNASNASLTRDRKEINHVMVDCKECSIPVTGVRYRCLQCHDFDFCRRCYKARSWKSHPQEHYFMSIPSKDWRPPKTTSRRN